MRKDSYFLKAEIVKSNHSDEDERKWHNIAAFLAFNFCAWEGNFFGELLSHDITDYK